MFRLDKVENLSGLRYLPDQNVWNPGIISNYEFYISNDSVEWKLVEEGKLLKIKNKSIVAVKKCFTGKSPLY